MFWYHETPLSVTAVLFLLSLLPFSGSACPCSNPKWCDTIEGPPIRPTGEVFGFYGSFVKANNSLPIGQDMNWTHVSTIAWADQDEIMCLSHQHGVRAVLGAPRIENLTALADPLHRSAWIHTALERVVRTHRDGMVFDFEDPLPKASLEGDVYALLIAETRSTFHQFNPSLQITTCVPWSPNNIDGRSYPFRKLAEASDALYVMDYDTRSQIFDACLAGANAPLAGMIAGMTEWFNLGVNPHKLILGVPWYGYKYPCLPGTTPDAIYCPIKAVPFRGVNCSDAAGKEFGHADIVNTIHATGATVRRDENTQTLFFNTVEQDPASGDAIVYQYWMEDPVLSRQKYGWAREQGLAGVGPYVFHNLDPVYQPEESQAMWSTFDVFLLGGDAIPDQRTKVD
jgi:di-N-acetylchitobiase